VQVSVLHLEWRALYGLPGWYGVVSKWDLLAPDQTAALRPEAGGRRGAFGAGHREGPLARPHDLAQTGSLTSRARYRVA
jgi:hypothetical protein